MYQREPGDWCDQWYAGTGPTGGRPTIKVRQNIELPSDDPFKPRCATPDADTYLGDPSPWERTSRSQDQAEDDLEQARRMVGQRPPRPAASITFEAGRNLERIFERVPDDNATVTISRYGNWFKVRVLLHPDGHSVGSVELVHHDERTPQEALATAVRVLKQTKGSQVQKAAPDLQGSSGPAQDQTEDDLPPPDKLAQWATSHATQADPTVCMDADWYADQVRQFAEALRDELDDGADDLPDVVLVVTRCGKCKGQLSIMQYDELRDSLEQQLRCSDCGGHVLKADHLFFHRATLDLLHHAATLKWDHSAGTFASLVRTWQKAGCPDKDGPPRVSHMKQAEVLDLDLARTFAGVPEIEASISVRRGPVGWTASVGEGWASSYRVIAEGKGDTMYDAIADVRANVYGDKDDDQGELPLEGKDD